MTSKESGKVRYAYGVAMALLLGGTAFSLATGQAGAQVAQNAPSALAPRPGAPMSFADLVGAAAAGGGQYLDQAARAGQSAGRSVRGILPPLRPDACRRAAGRQRRRRWRRRAAPHPRSRLARLGLHHLARRLYRHQQPFDPGRQRHRNGRHRHRHHHRPQGISRADRRPRRNVGPRAAQDRGQQPAVSCNGATAPRRGSATGCSRSATPMALAAPSPPGSSPRSTAGSPASAPTTATSRPTPPSTWATAAARCSISTATSSASIRR